MKRDENKVAREGRGIKKEKIIKHETERERQGRKE